ncbi:hypothetical protein GLOTRDRAFT_134140 [Gloeophyllum trabeum ATCC 11539]|uniref:DUF6532 domain-containing protein n=1 Tax=Gloeophyllum trabeum (strain ATCC 11539 / FP-39264 / Madison 617) TaxID=670483 RepID=S7PQY0_GLOTA|nr:uncharacterized protein GLOTRDRAFT_134140 [Gloeophyllum trabeum ATCC 11539]EPQ50226.1 hypothetical protein GLOTRDRAFT_134140 [Gloeophyllum trabeum ATCC 11539]
MEMIVERGTQLRGEIKFKARPLVKITYSLRAPANQEPVLSNCNRVSMLLECLAFTYLKPEEQLCIYEHLVIQELINDAWFQNPKDEGVIYSEYFGQRMPLPTLALVLTAIENVLDEWRTGEYHDIPFSKETYQEKYDKHLLDLENFQVKTKETRILPTI